MCASVTVRPSGLRRRSISERTRRPVSSANIRDWSRIGLRRAFETILVMEAAEDQARGRTTAHLAYRYKQASRGRTP